MIVIGMAIGAVAMFITLQVSSHFAERRVTLRPRTHNPFKF